jgi:hypothetical protein
MSAPNETHPIPPYGLAGSFSGVRWIEGEGRDLCTVVHRVGGSQETVTVGVDRRPRLDHRPDTPQSQLPADLARLGMATALVVDLPKVGDRVFEVAAEVAEDENAWQECQLTVDGQIQTGYEREYGGRWIAYCLTDTLVIYVLAPAALRLDAVELRKLEPDEATRGVPVEAE